MNGHSDLNVVGKVTTLLIGAMLVAYSAFFLVEGVGGYIA